MKKYIVFGYSNPDKHDSKNEPSNEERQLIYKKWMEWQEELGELLVSMGSPLINGNVINQSGVVDEKVSNLSGYMIIKAEDVEHAMLLLNKSPLFGDGHGQNYELFECIM